MTNENSTVHETFSKPLPSYCLDDSSYNHEYDDNYLADWTRPRSETEVESSRDSDFF